MNAEKKQPEIIDIEKILPMQEPSIFFRWTTKGPTPNCARMLDIRMIASASAMMPSDSGERSRVAMIKRANWNKARTTVPSDVQVNAPKLVLMSDDFIPLSV